MPILTQPTSHSQRRRPWLWVFLGVPGVVSVLLMGVVVRGWFLPVELALGKVRVGFLHLGFISSSPSGWAPRLGSEGQFVFHLPGDQKDRRWRYVYIIHWSF